MSLVAIIAIGIFITAQFCNGSESEPGTQTATTAVSSPTRVPPARPTQKPAPSPIPVPTSTFEELWLEAVEIEYDDLFRNNEDHVGKRIRFVAEIIQVVENADGDNQFILRGNVTRGKYSWDDAVLLAYAGPRLLEDDIVEMVGIVLGLYTYEAVLGNEVTVPHIRVIASQRVDEVGRVVATQTPIVVVETVEVEVVKVVDVEKEVVVEVVQVVEVDATPTPLPSPTPGPTETPVPTPTPTPTPGPTETPVPTPTPTPTPGPTETPAPTPTPTPTPEPPSTPAELVEWVQESVVRVKARSGSIFGSSSAGSGFIFAVEGSTAFVATTHHIIDGSNSVEVEVVDSGTYDALVLGWDADRDVAVLSICCSFDFLALEWGDASASEGEPIVAVGYPGGGGGNLVATIGEVRAADVLSITHDFIPHSAPLNPGNSGGPLFSMPGGKVVGINTAGGTETLTFYAVPYRAIEAQVDRWRSQLVVGGSDQNVIADLTATDTPVPTAPATPELKSGHEAVIVASHDRILRIFDDDELQIIANALGFQEAEMLNVEPGIGLLHVVDIGIHSGIYTIEFVPFDASFSGYKPIDSESPIRFFGRVDANGDGNYSEPLQDLTGVFIQLDRLVTAGSAHEPPYLEIIVVVPADSGIKLEAIGYYTPNR